MKRQPVASSNVRSVGYDPKSDVLEIEFHSGDVYQYDQVHVNTYNAMLRAASPGAYVHKNLIGKYPYRKV